MKVLIVSNDGLATALAWQLRQEGHSVVFYIGKPECQDILDGVVEKTNDWEAVKDECDLIIFDDTGFGARADELKEDGYQVVGASALCDRLEKERDFGVEFAKKTICKLPETKQFNNFDDAIKFVSDSKSRWVIKFNGEAGNHKDLLYISQRKDNKDLIRLMEHYKRNWHSKLGDVDFVLQQVIDGVEVGVSACFNGEGFVLPYYIDHEYKRALAGDVGVFTGQEGEIMIWSSEYGRKLFDGTLKRIEDDLRKVGYVGMFNINGIINDEGYWFLEWTPRFGYNSQAIEIEALKYAGHKYVNWIYEYNLKHMEGVISMGVVVSVPPYPHGNEDVYEQLGKNLPLIADGVSGFYPHDLKWAGDGWITAGSAGYCCTVATANKLVNYRRIADKCYEEIDKIVLPKMQYRNDCGVQCDWEAVLDAIASFS